MSLYKYFKPSSSTTDLPNPSGLNPAVIKEIDEAVRKLSSEESEKSKKRGSYSKFSPEQQAEIGKYASENGNQAAFRYFSKQLKVELKMSSIQTWKSKYLAEVDRIRTSVGTVDNFTIKSLPVKKRGRPLLIGEKLDSQVNIGIRELLYIAKCLGSKTIRFNVVKQSYLMTMTLGTLTLTKFKMTYTGITVYMVHSNYEKAQ